MGALMYSEKLAKLRKKLDLSQNQISTQIGISYRAYTSYERGDRKPSLEFIEILAKKFDVDLNWFFIDKGGMFINNCENTHILIKNNKPNENFKCWGRRLAQILSENQETPYSFAKLTGIKEHRIESFILDSSSPTIDELNLIKSNIDISIDELLYGETISKKQINRTQDKNIDSCEKEVSLSSEEILKLKKFLSQSNI